MAFLIAFSDCAVHTLCGILEHEYWKLEYFFSVHPVLYASGSEYLKGLINIDGDVTLEIWQIFMGRFCLLSDEKKRDNFVKLFNFFTENEPKLCFDDSNIVWCDSLLEVKSLFYGFLRELEVHNECKYAAWQPIPIGDIQILY